jgi:hypothetical protein
MFLNFLISVLNIWNNFKVLSRFMQNWTQSPACLVHGLHRMLSSYWLEHFHFMKKSAKVKLYFGSGCGMMKFFTCEPQSKEQLMPLPHLWNTEKDRGLSTCKPWTEQAGGLEAFLHGAAQNFEVVLKIQDQK